MGEFCTLFGRGLGRGGRRTGGRSGDDGGHRNRRERERAAESVDAWCLVCMWVGCCVLLFRSEGAGVVGRERWHRASCVSSSTRRNKKRAARLLAVEYLRRVFLLFFCCFLLLFSFFSFNGGGRGVKGVWVLVCLSFPHADGRLFSRISFWSDVLSVRFLAQERWCREGVRAPRVRVFRVFRPCLYSGRLERSKPSAWFRG